MRSSNPSFAAEKIHDAATLHAPSPMNATVLPSFCRTPENVRKNLARMLVVGQRVDGRDAGKLRELLHVALRERADDRAVDHPAQHARGVLDRLAAAQLNLVRVKNIVFSPSSRMPTSNETRVRVDDLETFSAQVGRPAAAIVPARSRLNRRRRAGFFRCPRPAIFPMTANVSCSKVLEFSPKGKFIATNRGAAVTSFSSPRPPRTRDTTRRWCDAAPTPAEREQFLRLGQVALFVGEAEAGAHAEIVRRQDVGPAELENQQHLHRPAPTPRTSVSRAMISSSDNFAICRDDGTTPDSVFSAMLRMDLILANENPQAR